jgi:2-amino-4-hydroxy-6-hydroxymethyldihydropteridine diphosphokinase
MHFIAIGANLPDPVAGRSARATCEWAVGALATLRGLTLVATSRWFASRAEPPAPGQPDYVNGIVRLDGAIAPEVLLALLQAIENAAGRVRSVPNAARTLDLDIVAMGDLVRAAPAPVLPHPRAHLRRFVLEPLAEVAPGWRHPVLGRTVEALLAELPPASIRPL